MQCLRPAVLATESSLELALDHRRRTVWRLDGGSGTDEQFRWLLSRGYHIIAKGKSNFRANALASQAQRWDAYDDYQLAEVLAPLDYGRPVRMFVKRRRKAGRWHHSYFLSTLTLPSKGHFMHYYHQRGGAEVEQFRQDKQGLDLATRRKYRFAAQQGYILLTDLTHNLLADFHHRALIGSRFEPFGLRRIVRQLLNIPGRLVFDGPELKRIELLTLNHFSKDLIICLKKYCLGE